MPEVNSLVLQVKSDSVALAAGRLDRMTLSATKAELSQKGLATSGTASNVVLGKTAITTGAAAASTTTYAVAIQGAAVATTGFALATKSANVPLALMAPVAAKASKAMVILGASVAVVAAGAVALSLAWVFAASKVIGVAGELEHSLSGVEAVTGATAEEMQNLEDVARELGSTTVFSASEAADGMQFLGMAGFETNEIIAAMPGLLDLAAAGQLGLAEASDIASNVLSGFRLEVDQTGRVSDVLALGAASANTSVQQLGNALSFAAPIAAALGIEIEETAAAIGVLSDAGIQGQRAGTGLRTVFAALSADTPEVQKAVEGLGLTMESVNPQANSLGEILQTLEGAGLDAASAFKIFGREGAPAILALTSQVGSFVELTESLEDAEGAAGDMAITLSDDLFGSYKQLEAAASEFALTLNDSIKGSATWRATIDVLTESINDLSDSLGIMAENGAEGTKDIHELLIELDLLEKKQKSLGGGAIISRVQTQASITGIRTALSSFSEYEIALASAENTLQVVIGREKELNEEISKGFFESTKSFESRKASQQLGLEGTALQIASLEEQIFLLKETVQLEKSSATSGVVGPLPQADAPTATGSGEEVSLELERLIRQLETEEEAIESSFKRRNEIILANTEENSALRLDLETRAANERTDAISAIEKKAADEEQALRRAQFENFQQVTMLTATLTGQLANMAEEGSSAQKALFIAQKGISIAQAIVNTELAATAALATSVVPFTQIPMATAIRAFGYASVGIMAGQAVGSFATGGVVPGTSFTGDSLTANVNSGEMILNGPQQARLFDIANNGNQTGSGVNITIENHGSSEFTVEQISETDIRIIARDQARQVVREDAPSVIASDLQSANSRTSRSLSRNTKTERRR